MPKTDPQQVVPRLAAGPASGDLFVRASCLRAFLVVIAVAALLFPGAMVVFTVPENPAPAWAENLYRRTDAMLVSSEGEPRLVVVGGSGVLFGVRSDILEAATGLRTVNRGSHAGLSSRVIAARAKRHLRSGDKLIVSMEYPAYDLDPPRAVPDMAWQQAAYYDLRMLGGWGVRSAASSLVRANIDPGRALAELGSRFATLGPGRERYALGGLSRHGDGLWIPARFEVIPPVGFDTPSQPDRRVWGASIRELLDWAAIEGIDTAIVPPAILRPEGDLPAYTALGPALERVAKRHGAVVLGAPARHFFDDWQMADTHYHLTPGAAIENTWRLIESLEQVGWARLPEPAGRVVLGASSDSALCASLLSSGVRPVFTHQGIELEPGDLTDDASVLAGAIAGGLKAEIVSYDETATVVIPDDTVIAFGSVQDVDLGAVRAWLPDVIAGKTDRGGGIVGIGRYADLHSSRDEDGAVSASLSALTAAGGALRHELAVTASARGVSIIVNGMQMVRANRRSGFHAVVFDPSLGVVTSTLRFGPDGAPVRPALWRLSEGGAGVVRRDLGLDRLGARGVRPPDIDPVEGGVRVLSAGLRSFAAVRFDASELALGWHWVEFVVDAPADAAIDACVFTPGGGHLVRAPWSARVPTLGGETRFVVPIDVGGDGRSPIQAGFCMDLKGMGVTVRSITLVSPVRPGDAPL